MRGYRLVLSDRNYSEPGQNTTIKPAASNSTYLFGNADVTEMPVAFHQL